MKQYASIEEHISSFPPDTQAKLRELHKVILAEAPGAQEKIAYGIPTLTLNGRNLVHFAGFKTHIGFYPGADGVAAFKNELKDYETSKGTVRFPLDKPLPLDLIRRVTAFRVAQETN